MGVNTRFCDTATVELKSAQPRRVIRGEGKKPRRLQFSDARNFPGLRLERPKTADSGSERYPARQIARMDLSPLLVICTVPFVPELRRLVTAVLFFPAPL
jgi:hypothetical protein